MNVKENELRTSIRYRKPQKEDGPQIWELIKGTNVLDVNSTYTYLLLCEYFPDTCVIAELDQELVGFVSAFISPQQKDTLFVWQVAVHESVQGKGIAKQLLQELLSRTICEKIHYVEATVSPSNRPSQALFKGLAKKLSCSYAVSDLFSPQLFSEQGHEAEELYKIGPFKR